MLMIHFTAIHTLNFLYKTLSWRIEHFLHYYIGIFSESSKDLNSSSTTDHHTQEHNKTVNKCSLKFEALSVVLNGQLITARAVCSAPLANLQTAC